MTNLLNSFLKKCLAVTVTSIIVLTGSCSFAMANMSAYPSISAITTENAINTAVDTENVNGDLKEDKTGYHSEGDSIDVDISKNPEDGITMDSKDFGIVSMGLPRTVAGEKGEMVNGTVMFESQDGNVTIAVQTENDQGDADAGSMVRSLIVIDSDKAPDEYSFVFDLKKGQSLKYEKDARIAGEDSDDADRQNGQKATNQTGEIPNKRNDRNSNGQKDRGKIYVMQGKAPVCEIQPAWAKDADGNEIDTYYEIRGNELVQTVNFDENTKFPVVADPAISGYYYRKKSVKIMDAWGPWKRTSSILNTYGTKGGTLYTNECFTISGSVTGDISGIATIGVGTSFSSASGKTWNIGKNKRCYLECRAKYKVERGIREMVRMSTGRVMKRNKYMVKRPLGKLYKEHKVRYIKKNR